MADGADFVIVGGGSAGCVLAHRLSEKPGAKVVLLEAGGSSDRFWVNLPAGFTRIVADPQLNWLYRVEPDPTLNGRSLIWHAGRLLGGGSAINGMAYIRGSRSDYDAWAAAGCHGWSWRETLPYFTRAETFDGPPSQTHGSAGPLRVSRLRAVHPLARAFLEACSEVGLQQVEDYCNGDIDGAFENLATQGDGLRSSTARSYLREAKSRPNLRIVTGALVDRVIIEGGRAAGVVFRQGGVEQTIRADREVVLSAGAMQSPVILMRSGIGPGGHLQEMGLNVIVDAPGVGRNLHEHASLHNSRLVDVETYNAIRNPLRLALEAATYVVARKGLLATCAVHAMAHARSKPDLPQPDIKLQFMPYCMDPSTQRPHQSPGVGAAISNMFPKARGAIRLRSPEPDARPVIDYKIYEHSEDLAVMRAGMEFVDRLFDAPALARHVVGRASPPATPTSDEEWEDWIRSRTSIGFHPVGSCRMGSDPASVVDPTLRVRGVRGLRVVDASIMPTLPSANTNAPTIMVAEKAADLIMTLG